MQSGLPVGFYKSLQAKNPKQDILSTTTRVSNGKKYADVISRNSDGSLSTKSILIGGTSTGSGSSSAGTVKSGSALFSKSQLSQLEGRLDQSRGQDGYVDPDVYKQAFEAWTDPSVGGLSKDFLAKYPPKNYVNPANDQLPNYLRSGNKASTTSTKGRSI
jgi:hypothetical protein